MPCSQQALKTRRLTAAEDRCAMIRLAIADNARLTLDCRELTRTGKTYTYDTLVELRNEMPEARLWFICGMDSVRDFAKWHRARELLDLCEFIAFDRPGVEVPDPCFDPRLLAHRLTGPRMDLSSTELRQAVASDAPIRYSIGHWLERYLSDHHLYRKEF